jgi:endonuclease/exonuclease/phosphatase (EEP) superfamily protein YafD
MKSFAAGLLVVGVWIYFAFLFGWLAAYLLVGDRNRMVSLLNLLAVYWFLPLLLIILANLFLRRPAIWAAVLIGGAAFIWLWGGLFLPGLETAHAGPSDTGTLTVMTFNVLGRQSNTAPQIETLRQENADVVLIQELNHDLAGAIQRQLTDLYPYQALKPGFDVEGMGILSKYPLRSGGFELPLSWTGIPQVLVMDWHGQPVTLINFHMTPTTLRTASRVDLDNRRREAQADALVEAADRAGSVIAAGDANATPLNASYHILGNRLKDSWKEAGFGLGHTFPGSDVPGSSRPDVWGVPVPMWLARIDYIFHTPDWQAVSTRVAHYDGASDHRGVIAVLKRVVN